VKLLEIDPSIEPGRDIVLGAMERIERRVIASSFLAAKIVSVAAILAALLLLEFSAVRRIWEVEFGANPSGQPASPSGEGPVYQDRVFASPNKEHSTIHLIENVGRTTADTISSSKCECIVCRQPSSPFMYLVLRYRELEMAERFGPRSSDRSLARISCPRERNRLQTRKRPEQQITERNQSVKPSSSPDVATFVNNRRSVGKRSKLSIVESTALQQ
jgi:hypothetical protein